MQYIYNIKSIKLDEESNKSTVIVACSVDGEKKEDVVGTFLGGVPMKTVVNWLKSTIEPSDTLEITYAKGIKATAPEPEDSEESVGKE